MARRRLLLLLFLLGTPLFVVRLDGASGFPVPNPLQRQVHGIVGGSILLPALIPPGKAMTEIEWGFRFQNGSDLAIADFKGGKFERPNPGDRFQQRLERANETTLRVKDLVKEDSGLYTAHVTFGSAEMQELTFLLVVSDVSGQTSNGTTSSRSDKSEAIQCWKLLIWSFIILRMPFLI